MQKYGLKFSNNINDVWYKQWTESVDDVPKPYLFNTPEAAEEFRDNHELKIFVVEKYNEHA